MGDCESRSLHNSLICFKNATESTVMGQEHDKMMQYLEKTNSVKEKSGGIHYKTLNIGQPALTDKGVDNINSHEKPVFRQYGMDQKLLSEQTPAEAFISRETVYLPKKDIAQNQMFHLQNKLNANEIWQKCQKQPHKLLNTSSLEQASIPLSNRGLLKSYVAGLQVISEVSLETTTIRRAISNQSSMTSEPEIIPHYTRGDSYVFNSQKAKAESYINYSPSHPRDLGWSMQF